MKTEEKSAPQSGHEQRDADVMSLGMIGVALFISVVVVIFACWGLLHAFNRHRAAVERPRPKVAETQKKFPAPGLETQPGVEWQNARVRETQELNSYGWVNRKAGIVRIPIGRAMELIAARGLPDVGAGVTPLQLMQTRPNETGTSIPGPKTTPNGL